MSCLNTIQWTDRPTHLFYFHPYIVALLQSKIIEVRNHRSHELVQQIKMTLPITQFVNHQNILLANENSIWRLLPFDMEDQVIKESNY